MENAANRLTLVKDQVLLDWEHEMRKQIPEAADYSRPVLIDTIPKFLDNLVEALEPDHPRKIATEHTTIAQEHGGERARTTRFSVGSILSEFRILRETIFAALARFGPLTPEERRAVRNSIEHAARESAMAFAFVFEQIRQQFVATLTHDLRGPLTAAKANLDMILRSPDKRERVPVFAARAVENIKRTDKMISDLLDVTRMQSGEKLKFNMTEYDAVEFVRSVVEEFVTIYGDRIRFHTSETSCLVRWNGDAIRRVIENMVSNAVKYGFSNTPVTIEFMQKFGRIILTVHNFGPPIPLEDQQNLFQPFKRTQAAEQSRQKGWGLGLALVRGVAEGHLGSIILDSSIEKGTCFGIDILRDARAGVALAP